MCSAKNVNDINYRYVDTRLRVAELLVFAFTTLTSLEQACKI